MTKDEIIAELTKAGVEFDPSANKATLAGLLDAHTVQNTPTVPADPIPDQGEIIVKDPVNLVRDLPLVVTLPDDASKAQIAFAKLLNAYAYQNPEKWAVRKDGLIAELKALKNAPDPVENGN